MPRLILFVALSLFLSGCASEVERYQWNAAHAYVCPKARFLTRADLDEISRVVAHATPQVIMTINALLGSRTKLDVTTCYRGGMESENRDNYGFCTVEKIGSTWQVTKSYTNLDPALAHLSACAD